MLCISEKSFLKMYYYPAKIHQNWFTGLAMKRSPNRITFAFIGNISREWRDLVITN